MSLYSDGKFSGELRECIYSLLSNYYVSVHCVPEVIRSVLKLVGIPCDNLRLPSRSTVLNMNVERLIVCQTQLNENMPSKENLTLYSDETSKYGVKYCGYHVSDESGDMYVLGLRQLETKSAQNTLNAFEDILKDIEGQMTMKPQILQRKYC